MVAHKLHDNNDSLMKPKIVIKGFMIFIILFLINMLLNIKTFVLLISFTTWQYCFWRYKDISNKFDNTVMVVRIWLKSRRKAARRYTFEILEAIRVFRFYKDTRVCF